MILAGDIGGTKTLLGLFEPQRPRPRALITREFITLDHPSLSAMISKFAEMPEVNGAPEPLARLMVAQDTGTAIVIGKRTETVAAAYFVAGLAGFFEAGGDPADFMCSDCLGRTSETVSRSGKFGKIA